MLVLLPGGAFERRYFFSSNGKYITFFSTLLENRPIDAKFPDVLADSCLCLRVGHVHHFHELLDSFSGDFVVSLFIKFLRYLISKTEFIFEVRTENFMRRF